MAEELSHMTEDSHQSGLSKLSNDLSSVFSHAAKVLRGESISNSRMEPPIEEVLSREAPDMNGAHPEATEDGSEGETINFLADDPREMTIGRRIALSMMKKHKWYNPRLGEVPDEAEMVEEPSHHKMATAKIDAYPFSHSRREFPSLERAWAYFEHVALPRYVVESVEKKVKKNIFVRAYRKLFCKGGKQLDRAEPGEKRLPTKLYEPIFTPHTQLGDWGLGVGLYFSTLRAICVITFLAGLLNIPNFIYYSQDEYSQNQPAVPGVLKGSAICTNKEWVPCPDCNPDDFLDTRLVAAVSETTQETLFVLRNACEGATIEQAMVNFATLILIMVGTIGLNAYLKRMEIAFDEDEQTAQDYSIVIENPPGDATDPEEWRKFFFDQFDGAQVTACTVAVDNDLLVRSLVERREKLGQIQMMVEPGTSLDQLTLAGIAAKEERERRMLGRWMAALSPGVPELFARVVVLNAKVQGLAQQDYPATNVFVTFETEATQRRVLAALTVGSMKARRNVKSSVAEKHLFRGEHVLAVKEPDEPNTVRWQDLNEKFKDRLKQQALTLFATSVAIICIALIVRVCNKANVTFSAYAIAIFNSVFPMFAKMLTDTEAHSSEGGKQRSLYLKIAGRSIGS